MPRHQDEADEFSIYHTAPVRMGLIAITLLFGWPMYLLANVSGRPYDRWANHFDPYSPIFSKRERIEVTLLPAIPWQHYRALVGHRCDLIQCGYNIASKPGTIHCNQTYCNLVCMTRLYAIFIRFEASIKTAHTHIREHQHVMLHLTIYCADCAGGHK